jgi:hypothetical protein
MNRVGKTFILVGHENTVIPVYSPQGRSPIQATFNAQPPVSLYLRLLYRTLNHTAKPI